MNGNAPKNNSTLFIVLLLTVFVNGYEGASALAAHGWTTVFLQNKDAVVQIFSTRQQRNVMEPFKQGPTENATGSGFFISADGYLLTNYHVVDGSKLLTIQMPQLGNERIPVEFISACPLRDLALLKVDADVVKKKLKDVLGEQANASLPFIKFGNSETQQAASEVMVMGYPLGEVELKISLGNISGRVSTGEGELIQTTAAINPGNSGGPVLAPSGEVIAMCVAKHIRGEGVGYLIPADDIKRLLPEMRKTKFIRATFWGAGEGLQVTCPAMLEYLKCPAKGGVYVMKVFEHSQLEAAGLQVGDVLTAINGICIDYQGMLTPITGGPQLCLEGFLNQLPFGSEVEFEFYRQGKKYQARLLVTPRQPFKLDYHFPNFEAPIDYKVFGGMVIAPFTDNHLYTIDKLVPGAASFRRHAGPAYYERSQLIVSFVLPLSWLARARLVGRTFGLIKKVNGQRVTTLEEFDKAIMDHAQEKFITIEFRQGAFFVLPIDEILQEDAGLAEQYGYTTAPLTQRLRAARQSSQ